VTAYSEPYFVCPHCSDSDETWTPVKESRCHHPLLHSSTSIDWGSKVLGRSVEQVVQQEESGEGLEDRRWESSCRWILRLLEAQSVMVHKMVMVSQSPSS